MRVLYLIDSLRRGGAEQSLAALAPHLIDGGVDLEVAYLHERPGVRDDLMAAGVKLTPLTDVDGRLGWLRRARRLIYDRQPDLVHTTLFEADIVGRVAARLTRTPVVSSLVNVNYGPEQLSDRRLVPWRLRGAQIVDATTARLVVRFHAVSEDVANIMSTRLRIRSELIEVIPRGRDSARLGVRSDERKVQVREQLGMQDERVLLAVGRHEYQKGLDVLMAALPGLLASVPGARLLIAGREGNASESLRRLACQLGLDGRVSFLGHRDDVADLLCAADAFVFPSRWEGSPGALLEAMALEVPIVASDLPPVRELVSHGTTAWLVRPDDSKNLSEAIQRVISHSREAIHRARLARARFLECFTIERIAERMLGFYERAVQPKAFPAPEHDPHQR
jgi:glycosyltransferase involved in cell wall biosynthesis